MKIKITSVLVDEQEKALRFYTDTLGFMKKFDVPLGEARWLTVVSPEEPETVELLLEPLGIPAAVAYQKALYEAGIPLTMFTVDDIEAEYARLKDRGVVFRMPPTEVPGATIARFEDTCGNLIQLIQS